jgi:inorganic pyrophosphatase/exopolyphosphatase
VVEVIDHHEDSGLYTKQTQRHVDVEIEKVGSATTLVTGCFLNSFFSVYLYLSLSLLSTSCKLSNN